MHVYIALDPIHLDRLHTRRSTASCLASSSLADVPLPAIFPIFDFESSIQTLVLSDIDLNNKESLTSTSNTHHRTNFFSQESSNIKRTTHPTRHGHKKKQFACSSQSSPAVHSLQSCQLEHPSSHPNTRDSSSRCRQPESNVALTSKSSSSSNSNMLPSPSPSMSPLVLACVASSSTRRVPR